MLYVAIDGTNEDHKEVRKINRLSTFLSVYFCSIVFSFFLSSKVYDEILVVLKHVHERNPNFDSADSSAGL